jgi:hypothetical protein
LSLTSTTVGREENLDGRPSGSHQVGVGIGRLRAALPVAGGAWDGLRAARADLQVAAGIDEVK